MNPVDRVTWLARPSEITYDMNQRREYRNINGQLVGFSTSNYSGGEDFFNADSQRLGFTDGRNTYNNDSQLLLQGDAGAFLFGRPRRGRF